MLSYMLSTLLHWICNVKRMGSITNSHHVLPEEHSLVFYFTNVLHFTCFYLKFTLIASQVMFLGKKLCSTPADGLFAFYHKLPHTVLKNAYQLHSFFTTTLFSCLSLSLAIVWVISNYWNQLINNLNISKKTETIYYCSHIAPSSTSNDNSNQPDN